MEFQVRKLWSTVLSTHRTGWSTSAAKSAEPKAAERDRRMELQVRKLWRTVLSTLRTGWSTSAAESAEPKAAASYGLRVAGTKTVEYCAQHAPDGMVNVSREKCRTEGCGKRPSHGVSGAKTVEYCEQHVPDGMVNVCSRKCRTESCGSGSSYGVAGTKTVKYCAQVLCTARTGRDGQRLQQKVQNRRLWKGAVI